MRVPKVGEKWLRKDGGENNITVIQVMSPPGSPGTSSSQALAFKLNTKIRYRYDDGVDSEKFLSDFHQKFKEPAPAPRCKRLNNRVGVQCELHEGHAGRHQTMEHEWEDLGDSQRKAFDADLIVRLVCPEAEDVAYRGRPVMSREQFKTYYGYDQVSDDPQKPRAGDWNDSEYRKRYMGFK